jgi:biotin operon repressor
MEAKKNFAKKALILYVLNILKLYSSEEYPISQTALCRYLNEIGVACDRKTVGRNLQYLRDFGYPIKKENGKGYYLDKKEMEASPKQWIL